MKKRGIAILLVVTLLFVLLPETVSANTPEEGTQKLLAGKYISVMGDSISTYMGWSDSKPISGE